MTKIYLDLCCFNRPYDSQSQTRIRLETIAKMRIQELVRNKQLSLVWSYMLDLENNDNPDSDRRTEIFSWHELSEMYIQGDDTILAKADILQGIGLKKMDSLHVVAAIEATCTYFITTDDNILKRAKNISDIEIINPVDLILKLEGDDANR